MWKVVVEGVRRRISPLLFGAAVVIGGSLSGSSLVPPALADVAVAVLTPDQAESIRVSLTAAIKAAKGDDAAIKAAIAQALQNAVAKYGEGAAASITSTILVVAEAAGASAQQTGSGLAMGAIALSATMTFGHSAVGTTLAGEGNEEEVAACVAIATANGDVALAAECQKPLKPVKETPDVAGADGGGGLTGATNPSCLNPSCTTL